MSFDPQNLTPSISLNRVRMVELPGVEVTLEGRSVYEWLGAAAIADRVRLAASKLDLDKTALPSSLLPAFDDCLVSPQPHIQQMAHTIAGQLGLGLACLVTVLKPGDAANRAARTEWDDEVWNHWTGIERIWFGGGLMSGNLGQQILEVARTALDKWTVKVNLECAPHPTYLPLIGAARGVSETHLPGLVMDFGGSWVKRARAGYQSGQLESLVLFPPLHSPQHGNPEQQQGAMVEIILASLREAGVVSSQVAVSLAAYIHNNQPLQAQGGVYAPLGLITPNLGATLSQAISQRLGNPVQVELIHDGTAAARAFAGHPNSAVIQMGTALGIGFPPEQIIIPLSPNFQIR